MCRSIVDTNANNRYRKFESIIPEDKRHARIIFSSTFGYLSTSANTVLFAMAYPMRNILTPEMYGPPQSKYFEIFGPPLKYLDRVRSACCSRVVNCTKNGKTRFVRSWDDTLLTSDMIECSNCEEWFHVPSCSSPTQAALNDTTSLWFCNKCNN